MNTVAATLLAAAMLPLAACATMTPDGPPAGPCAISEQARMRFIGTEFREHARAAIERATHSRASRVLHPDDAATMDFRPDRLNILLDDHGQIAGLRCG